MADIQHAGITDPNIHEPKGASTASIHTTYISDGSGSGSWKNIDKDALNAASIQEFIEDSLDDGSVSVTGRVYLTTKIDDVSTAGSVLVPVIEDCTVIGARLVLGGTITAADASVSFVDATNASLGSAVTIAESGSAEGTGFSFTATTNQELTGPTYIKITTDGASTGAVPLYITVEFEQVLNV